MMHNHSPSDLGYAFAVVSGIITQIITKSWAVASFIFIAGFVCGVVITYRFQQGKTRGKR